MRTKTFLRLSDAFLLIFVLLLPLMMLLGLAQGTTARPSLVFWVLLLLPLLLVPWLWSRRALGEASPARIAAAGSRADTPDATVLASAAANVMDIERTYLQDGIPVAEGRLRVDAAAAFRRLEAMLGRAGQVPLLEAAGAGLTLIVVPVPGAARSGMMLDCPSPKRREGPTLRPDTDSTRRSALRSGRAGR